MATENYVTLNWANSKIVEIKNLTAPYTHYLSAQPTTGQIETVKDVSGNCGTYNITVNGNPDMIDSLTANTYVMSVNYEAVRFYWNGNNWGII